jgi:hypothetical protein
MRHFAVCEELGVNPYGPVVAYAKHVVDRKLVDGEGLPSTELKTPKTTRPKPKAKAPKVPFVLIETPPPRRRNKRKEFTPESPTTVRSEETEAMDEEWKETQGSPPARDPRSTRELKGKKKTKREVKKEDEGKTIISQDMSQMEVMEDSELSPEVKRFFPRVSTSSRELREVETNCHA